MKKGLILILMVFLLASCKQSNTLTGVVLENRSQITQKGIEYSAKIAVTDKLGHEQWIWVSIPERHAKVYPLGSWLIVDLSEPGYGVLNAVQR